MLEEKLKRFKEVELRTQVFLNDSVFSLKLSYIPVCMGKLQMLVDTNRLRTDIPVDLTQLVATGLFSVRPEEKEGGFMLEDDVS